MFIILLLLFSFFFFAAAGRKVHFIKYTCIFLLRRIPVCLDLAGVSASILVQILNILRYAIYYCLSIYVSLDSLSVTCLMFF